MACIFYGILVKANEKSDTIPELMKFQLQHPVLIVCLDLIFCILRNPWKLIFNLSSAVIPSVVVLLMLSAAPTLPDREAIWY